MTEPSSHLTDLKTIDGISYRQGNALDLDAMIDLYRESTLGIRRPIDDRARMASMFEHANLVITAWNAELPVGISRAFSDFTFATYLSDLAVRESHQRTGIGRELVRLTKQLGGPAKIILLAAPAAEMYYPRIGFRKHPQAWVMDAADELK